MASSLLDPVAQHAADIVQARGLGIPDRNALMAGVLSQRTPKSSLFSKDSKAKERDLRVFLFNCAIVLLTPNPNEKEKGWVLFCEPIPIELLTLRAVRPPPTTPHSPQARRSWFLDRLPAATLPPRAKTPPPFSNGKERSSTPPSANGNGNGNSDGNGNGVQANDFALVLSTLGRKDPSRTWPITLHAFDATEQRAWAQQVSSRQEDIRVHGRDGTMRGWGLVPIKVGALGGSRVTCYVDYDAGYAKARLWGTPDGLYEHILNAPNQQTAARKILDLPDVTHVLVMDFDERLMIVLVAAQTAYLAPFPGSSAMLEVSRLKKLATNITHIAAGVLVSQPTPPANAASPPPSAFVAPEEKRERRKSATLTKPPPRGAVVSGASSTKSEVPSMARKEKDRESVRTGATPATPTIPSVVASAAPAGPTTTAPASSTAAPAASSTASPTTLAPTATPRQSLSPGKGKDKEKKPRRLSDIGIFSLWKRKPEKDKTKKAKSIPTRASTASPGLSPSSAQTSFNPNQAVAEAKLNQAATAKSESAVSSLKPSPVEYDGPALTKSRSVTLPQSLMRLPSFEFDRPETNGEGAKETETPKANGNGNAQETKPASVHESPTVDEVGALPNPGRPSVQSQTMPSRTSTGGGGLGRLGRKLTTDSNRSVASKPKEAGPPPKIQIALDFPSIAWPSVLDSSSSAGRDKFATSDFLADVQKDIGDLMAGGLGMSLTEEIDAALGQPKSSVPEAITEEPEGMKTPAQSETKEGGEGNGNGEAKESNDAPAPGANEAQDTPAPGLAPPAPSQAPPQIQMATPAQASPRSSQPQHTRFLVLSKSTTLSTNVKLYTVGGLKVEDDGDIGGGRLTFFKECYLGSQTFSIDFLKSRICFSSTDGFEIMDPTTGQVDAFLDPVEVADADGPLGFLIKHPRRPKACQVFRVDQKFLCCYDEFAFFLDKFGKRTREDWLVKWLGVPTSFAVQYPYLFAFEPEFTEVRHCATGELLQLIPQSSMKRLPSGEFIAPAQKLDGVPNRRITGEMLVESEGSLYALRPLQQ